MSYFRINRVRGLSLLEVVMAITLLGVIIPALLGMFFSHVNFSEYLLVQGSMRDALRDVKSFVKLSNYEDIFALAKNNSLLIIDESVDDDGIVTRHFVEYAGDKEHKNCNFFVKFEFSRPDFFHVMTHEEVANSCVIPLRCNIYHTKRRKEKAAASIDVDKLCDMEHCSFIVKNR